MATAYLYDPRCKLHSAPGLPERPERIDAIHARLASTGLLKRLTPVAAAPATPAALKRVHTPAYLKRLREACLALGPSDCRLFDCDDVIISHDSWEVALLAAGGAMALCDAIMEGRATNGFANIRPPGHHAERDRAMGFCLLANVAIAARHLQKNHGLKKIAIVDWDVHHGNGTQHIFEADPSVLFISLHQKPSTCYPGTGYINETGTGKGSGFTINIPLPPGTDDELYKKAFTAGVIPALKKFAPQAILISAGFDAHADDPLAELQLSSEIYGWMTRELMAVAKKSAKGRVISILEGGYNLDALAQTAHAHIEALATG